MLVLTRRRGEGIFINGNEIEIRILGVLDKKVRIGINAPKSVSIHREEVHAMISAQRTKALTFSETDLKKQDKEAA